MQLSLVSTTKLSSIVLTSSFFEQNWQYDILCLLDSVVLTATILQQNLSCCLITKIHKKTIKTYCWILYNDWTKSTKWKLVQISSIMSMNVNTCVHVSAIHYALIDSSRFTDWLYLQSSLDFISSLQQYMYLQMTTYAKVMLRRWVALNFVYRFVKNSHLTYLYLKNYWS